MMSHGRSLTVWSNDRTPYCLLAPWSLVQRRQQRRETKGGADLSRTEAGCFNQPYESAMSCATVFRAIFVTWFQGPYWPITPRYVCEIVAADRVNIRSLEPDPPWTSVDGPMGTKVSGARVGLQTTQNPPSEAAASTTLIDRYLSHKTRSVTKDPWAAFDHFMSGRCTLDLRLTTSSQGNTHVSAPHLANLLVTEAVLPQPPLPVDLAITRLLHVTRASSFELAGTSSSHLFLPTKLGEELRNHYVSRGAGFVPAASYELASVILPEVAHGLIPVFDTVPASLSASTPVALEVRTLMSVRYPNLYLIVARPFATVRTLLAIGLQRLLDEARALHALLLKRRAYRDLWFRYLRDTVRQRIGVGAQRRTQRNRWLPRSLARD